MPPPWPARRHPLALSPAGVYRILQARSRPAAPCPTSSNTTPRRWLWPSSAEPGFGKCIYPYRCGCTRDRSIPGWTDHPPRPPPSPWSIGRHSPYPRNLPAPISTGPHTGSSKMTTAWPCRRRPPSCLRASCGNSLAWGTPSTRETGCSKTSRGRGRPTCPHMSFTLSADRSHRSLPSKCRFSTTGVTLAQTRDALVQVRGSRFAGGRSRVSSSIWAPAAARPGTGRRDVPSICRRAAFAREDFTGDFGHFLRTLPQQVDLVWCQHPGSGRGTEPPIE